MVTDSAGHERIEYHTLTPLSSVLYYTYGLMSENQRRHPASIMTMVCMHVRSTNANGLYFNQ